MSVVCQQRAPRDDEGPVRELRGAEDDRRGRAHAAQGADAQDPAARRLAPQVHLREAHHRQAREVLHEGARARPHRPAQRQPRLVAAPPAGRRLLSLLSLLKLAS